jgi:adenylylsulfate kinase-like enzyme
VPNTTEIDPIYEAPAAPEIAIDTTGMPATVAADQIVAYLREHGYV